MDSDCASKLACFKGDCKNPCYEIKPCGPNAECVVVDTLPHRTMSCQCIPGYVGDADIQCKLGNENCFQNKFKFISISQTNYLHLIKFQLITLIPYIITLLIITPFYMISDYSCLFISYIISSFIYLF